MNGLEEVPFRESQKLPVWARWLTFLLIIIFLLSYGIMEQQGRLDEDDVIGFCIGLPVLAAVTFLIYGFKLITEVRSDGVYIKCLPIQWKFKRISFEEMARCCARKYRPIVEYGGWGIRWGRSGKAYNAYGNMGVQLELTNGKRLLIGLQEADKLAEIINGSMKKTQRA